MLSSTFLLIMALYNAAFLQASSPVPPIGLSTSGSSLVLSTEALASASSGLLGGNSSSKFHPSLSSAKTLPSQSKSDSSTQTSPPPSSTAKSSSGSAPASSNSVTSLAPSSYQTASSVGSAPSLGPSFSANSTSLAGPSSPGVSPSAGSSASKGPPSTVGSFSSAPSAPSSVFGQTAVVATFSDVATTETFIPTIYPEFSRLTALLSTFTIDAQSSTIPLIVGPGGIGWQIPSQPPSAPEIPPPTALPSPPTLPPANSITSAPSSTRTLSGAEITSTSIEGVTKNTKTTTLEDGHQTVLPIVFCLKCRGGGGGGGGLSWIIHPPSINPPGGIELNIPGVKWPFTVDPKGDPQPVDPSKSEPEPDDKNNSSQSNESNSQSSTSQGTSSETSASSSASSSGSSSSSSASSSSSTTRTGTATIASDADVDPYFTDPPQDTIADVQAYLSSMFATEFDQAGTTLESMISSPTPNATDSSTPLSSTPPSSITSSPLGTVSTSTSTTPPQQSSTTSPPPSSGICNCNEDGCTPDSPACCATGSCAASVAAVPRIKVRRQ